MLKMVDGTGIIGVDMICPLGVSTPQPPNYDRVELEGTGILVLPNSLDAPLERLELGGKTEQVTTTGKNLFDIATCPLEHDGVSFKIPKSSGNVVLMGDFEENTQYTLSVQKITSENANSAVLKFDYTDGTRNEIKIKDLSKKSLTSDSAKNVKQFVLINPFGGVHEVSGLQLEKGTTATPYEPYTGGKPSPSPEYPQEIVNAGKWNEETQKYEVDVKITGKNLLDTYEKAEKDSEFYSVNDDGSLSQLKSDVRPYSDVPSTLFLKSGVYYFSLFNTGVTFKCYNAEADEVFAEIKEPKSILVNLRKDANIKYKVFSNGGSSKNVRVMVSKTKASEYEPYTEQTLTLTSDRPITKWDRLVEKGGEIGWLYGTKKYVVTGKENFTYGSENYYTSSRIDMFFEIRDATGNEAIMRDLSFVPSIWHLTDKEGFCINGKQLHIGLYNTRIVVSDDAAKEEKIKAYKEFMAKRYADGNPFEVYYKTTETEFIPLPQPEQNAIRALKTYYPTTVITTDGGELDPDIKVTYRKEI